MYPSGTGQSGQSNQDNLYYQYGYQECYWQPPPNMLPRHPNFTGYPPPPPPPPSQDPEQVYYSQSPYYHYPPPNPSVPLPPPGPWPVLEPVSSVELLREKLAQPAPQPFAPHEMKSVPASDKNEKLSKSPSSDKDTKSLSPPPISVFQLKIDRFTSQHKELFGHLCKSSSDGGREQQYGDIRCELNP